MRTHFAQVGCFTSLLLTALFLPKNHAEAKEACVTTNTGQTVCGELQEKIESSKTADFENLNVILRSCKRLNAIISCYLSVSAKKDGQPGTYCDSTKLFDLTGNEYFCQQGQIGKAKGKSGTDAYTWMLKDIPLTAIVTFHQISSSVKKIAGLEIGFAFSQERGSRSSNAKERAVFKNIPILE
jgi:hypothetical protein